MKWFKRLLGLKARGQEPTLPEQPSQITALSPNSDSSYYEYESVLDGVQLLATFHITTPHKVLIHHGEVYAGPPSKAPPYGTMSQGIWIHKTKSFKSLGLEFEDFQPSTVATDIGPLPPDNYLKFLINFRAIFESNIQDNEKLAQLLSLQAVNNEYSQFWTRLNTVYSDFPLCLFYRQLEQLAGVGPAIAKRLYEAGYHTAEQVSSARPTDLQQIKGISARLAKTLTDS